MKARGFTYIQQTTPVEAQPGNTWYNPTTQNSYYYYNNNRSPFSNNSDYVGGGSGGSGGTASFGDYGYIGGGTIGIGYMNNNDIDILYSIEKLQFSTDINFNRINRLMMAVCNLSACNSTTYGYFGCAGNQGYGHSYIDSLNFSNDSVQLLTNYIYDLYSSSSANSSQAGYFYGGINNRGAIITPIISRLIFSDNTTSQLTNCLSQSKYELSACNSSVAGYIGGGANHNDVSTIEKQIFSTEIVSIIANLQYGRSALSSFNSSTYGYFAGGSFSSFIERFDFTSNNIITMTTAFNMQSKYHCSCNNSTAGYTTGFYFGQYNGNMICSSIIDKYLFSNDSKSILATKLNTSRTAAAACQIGDFY